ncbi:MAG: helix-turn-helix domain-containing protein [Lachnospiraceae bacterium]|jgi:transcriptional regulator with XRE-family HTH domain|nr:helix-turn-helix domain-containing protein [Lachnospiraceae bacterium]
MGRKSIRENKNEYQLSREAAGLTRAEAAELMEYVSESRIEKIESEKSEPHPDEIMAMAQAYKKPSLCNYYCSTQCPLGQERIAHVEIKDLSQITLEMLATLNNLNKEKDRLIEITADGVISNDEMADFSRIKHQLSQIARTADSLQLWIENTIAAGGLDAEALK